MNKMHHYDAVFGKAAWCVSTNGTELDHSRPHCRQLVGNQRSPLKVNDLQGRHLAQLPDTFTNNIIHSAGKVYTYLLPNECKTYSCVDTIKNKVYGPNLVLNYIFKGQTQSFKKYNHQKI